MDQFIIAHAGRGEGGSPELALVRARVRGFLKEITARDFQALFGAPSPYPARVTAPPSGLFLEEVVYAGEYLGYISRYDHRTRQASNISAWPDNPSGWAAAQMKYRFQWTAPIAASPHDPSVLYHAAQVLFRSTDRGRSWTAGRATSATSAYWTISSCRSRTSRYRRA